MICPSRGSAARTSNKSPWSASEPEISSDWLQCWTGGAPSPRQRPSRPLCLKPAPTRSCLLGAAWSFPAITWTSA